MHQSFEPTFECPSFGCPMCSGEACSTCGAGYLTQGIALYECDHDVLDRHEGQLTEERGR